MRIFLTLKSKIIFKRKLVSEFDPDALSRFNLLGITNNRHKQAIDLLVKTFKSFNSIQSNFINFANPDPKNQVIGAMWIGIGNSDTQKLMNFMKPEDSDASFRLTNVNSIELSKFGFFHSGSGSKYLDTHLKPYSQLTDNNVQLSTYIYQNASYDRYNCLYGDIGANSASKYCYIDLRGTASHNFYTGDGTTGVSMSSDYGDGSNLLAMDGLYTSTRSGTVIKSWRNGIEKSTLTKSAVWDSGLDINMYLASRNNAGSKTADEKCCIRLASVGISVADALQSSFFTALKRFVGAINPVIVFFGDSITNGTGASSIANRWTTYLSQTLDSFIEWNIALDGTRLQSLTDGTDSAHATYGTRELLIPNRASNHYNELLIINLGVNDIYSVELDDARFKTQYLSVVNNQIAKGYSPSEIYIGNIPRAYQDYKPVNNTIFNAFQQRIYEVCQETGCHHVDVYSYMSANDTSNLWNVTVGNPFHLNDLGNHEIAAFWLTQIEIHV